jgi:hypothetical protein
MAPPDATPVPPRTRGPVKALFSLVADNLTTLVAVPVVAIAAVSRFFCRRSPWPPNPRPLTPNPQTIKPIQKTTATRRHLGHRVGPR